MNDRCCNNSAARSNGCDTSLDELSLCKIEEEGCTTVDIDLPDMGACNIALEGLEPEAAQELEQEQEVQLLQELKQTEDLDGPPIEPGKNGGGPGLSSLAGRRYSGTVLDKLISFLADLIKLLEIKLLKFLYRRRDDRIQLKNSIKVAAQKDDAFELESLLNPKKKKKKRVFSR